MTDDKTSESGDGSDDELEPVIKKEEKVDKKDTTKAIETLKKAPGHAYPTDLSLRKWETLMIQTLLRNSGASDQLERWWSKQIKEKTFNQLADTRYDPSEKSDRSKYRWLQTDNALFEMIDKAPPPMR